MKKNNKQYEISFKVIVDTTIQISAESYEQALTKAREYSVRDLVAFDTGFNDGSVAVTGVFNSSEEAK